MVWMIPEELKREYARLGSQPLYANSCYMSNIEYILYLTHSIFAARLFGQSVERPPVPFKEAVDSNLNDNAALPDHLLSTCEKYCLYEIYSRVDKDR